MIAGMIMWWRDVKIGRLLYLIFEGVASVSSSFLAL